MLGCGSYEVSIFYVVSPRGSVCVLSLSYFSFVGSSSKPCNYYLPLSMGEHHIQKCSKNNSGGKKK